jgi:NAD(P)-dependent dehydrogenase (short-subunit alcohol dehydrogenase family)
MTRTGKALAAGALCLGACVAQQAIRRRNRRICFRRRVVVITGGSRGLGLVLGRQFAAERAKLAILARDPGELERATYDLAARGAETLALPCDVTNQLEVNQAIEKVVERWGRLDVLVNNAGTIQVGPLDHMKLEDFDAALKAHVWAPLYTMLAALPHMRRRGEGRIVNVSSIGGEVAVPHLVPYSMSKFALVGLSEGIRAELQRENIYVTTICPGLMRTGSPGNALFKGQHGREFTWFAVFDSLPLASTSAERAARKIVEACRYGDARLTITLQAKLAVAMHALFPEFLSDVMALTNRLLPGHGGPEGDRLKTGFASRPKALPPVLTKLTDEAAARNNELPTESVARA